MLDRRAEATLVGYARDVCAALGENLVSLVLYGSAVGDDWVPGYSDLNTAIVVPRVTLAILDALAPVVARWRRGRLAVPLIVDHEWLAQARDIFPMELDDIHRRHRVLAGADPFAGLAPDPAALRRECEHEARGKLLRLRALFLDAGGKPKALERLMLGSLKSFLVLLRHLLQLKGREPAHGYAQVLADGESVVGPLPAMRRLLAHRGGQERLRSGALRAEFARYLGEVERIVAVLDHA
jgi:predicted nucleotidyltransferase